METGLRAKCAITARVAECFDAVHEALISRGLVHYEVSNYAETGQQAEHNLAYWRGETYLGLGCAGGPPHPAVTHEPPIVAQVPIVRVALLVQAEDVQIGSTGSYASLW